MRIRERIEWDPTPKRRSIHSPFSGSFAQSISKVLMSYSLCPSCILSGVSGKTQCVRFIVSPTMVALSHSNRCPPRHLVASAVLRGHDERGTIYQVLFGESLSPCERGLVEKLTVSKLGIFPILFGTGDIITVFLKIRLWLVKSQLSPCSRILFNPYPANVENRVSS